MKIKDALKVGDILYLVDPRKLSIKIFRISSHDEVVNHTTNFEDFSLICERKHSALSFDEFPFESKGLWYFLSEDEANNFIKAQIGM
jgi:hypothetical protein